MPAEARYDLVRLHRGEERLDTARRLALLAGDFRVAMQLVSEVDEIDDVLIGKKHVMPPEIN